MNTNQIIAIGHLFTGYQSDLNYIEKFIEFLSHQNTLEYCQNSDGTFRRFINDWQVARCMKTEYTQHVLECALEKFITGTAKDVDKFAEDIQKYTYGNAISLASKIMFLVNPWEVMPFDSRAREALKYKGKRYDGFAKSVEKFRSDNVAAIQIGLASVTDMLKVIEDSFQNIEQVHKIRENRFVDKWLWVGID